jgi:hypothetical protein
MSALSIWKELGFNVQGPLTNGYCDQPRLSKTVLYGALEGVCAAELGIDHNELNCPVDNHG